jgi:membrane-bound lytic murein transglycosylase B
VNRIRQGLSGGCPGTKPCCTLAGVGQAFPGSLLGLLLLVSSTTLQADEHSFLQRPEVQEYIRAVSSEHGLDQHRVAGLFADIKPRPGVLEAISRPAERVLNWRDYRPIFMTRKRMLAGQQFMREHRDVLQRAEQQYGVPASVIAAVIGVESWFGRAKGKVPALESLATLAFDYPPRASFFRHELTEFLQLTDEEGWDALAVRGSYAAAMGMPQFIASSYRRYAVDFNDDGERDLFSSMDDVIGSVANYFAEHGWRRGQPIAAEWLGAGKPHEAITGLLREPLEPEIAPLALRELGFPAEGDQPVSVMRLMGKGGEETWVGYTNFYTITRYNHSRLYAMAVFQLSRELAVSMALAKTK